MCRPALARADTGWTDWKTILGIYDTLLLIAPTVGARVAGAAAALEADGPDVALGRLDAMDTTAVRGYQPWWAVRAHALLRSGDLTGAADAFDRAAGMTGDPAIRVYLLDKRRLK